MPGGEADELPEEEIARRAPVWQALSELFLDTELQPDDHRRIAASIRRAGFCVAEAEAILRDEVAPIFSSNLMSVAGEWACWPDDFVRERILDRLRTLKRGSERWGKWGKPWGPFAVLQKFLADRRMALVRNDWDKIKGLVSETEGGG